MINHKPTISHTLEKINGEWFIWNGNPKLLRTQDAIAGPFFKRYKAFEAVTQLAMKEQHGDHAR